MNRKTLVTIFAIFLFTANNNVVAKTVMSFKVGKSTFKVDENNYSAGTVNNQFASFLTASSKTDSASLFLGITNPKKGKKYKLTSTNNWMSDDSLAGFGISITNENSDVEAIDTQNSANQINGTVKISKINKDGTLSGKFKLRADTFVEPSGDDSPTFKDEDDTESNIKIQKGKFKLKPTS